ncbi:ATP-dependent RNA helicase dbp6 [Imshaugia aleurites]|uniref:ATP-dependent RNA helicase n=1 Tax=Imshaugia aleurites TaxID=172621 RepID=A0A8H3ILU3_9LECA|nr:ATP-dependent RNA helicase dbp6 [Imshaugia aleurites]
MASAFYNRYIPPQPKTSDPIEPTRPAKKRKKSRSVPASNSQQAKPREEPGELAPLNGDHDDEETPLRSPDSEAVRHDFKIRNRHKTVLDKYGKAAKKSAELTDERVVVAENGEGERQEDVMDVKLHGLEPLPQPAPVIEDRKVSAFSALPEWLQAPVLASSADTVPFKDLTALHDDIVTSLEKRGYSGAFAIQSAVLPLLLPGPKQHSGDICISAATGSGKTLAYILPMVQSLRHKPVTRLRGLIVVPTRELVNQVRETLELCSASSGLKIATAVGSKTLKEEQTMLVEKGQRYDPEAYKAEQEKGIDEDEELMDWNFDEKFASKDDFELFYNHVIEYMSKVDILICTPGRLVEHIQSTTGFTLKHVQWLIIDEADRLLDESFQQWVDVVLPGLEYMPPRHALHETQPDISRSSRRREVRKIILSATMTRDISKLMTLHLRRPKLVVLEGRNQKIADEDSGAALGDEAGRIEVPATLEEYGVPIPEQKTQDKPLYLVQLLDAGSDPLIGKKDRSQRVPSKSSGTTQSDISADDEDLSQDSGSPSESDDLSSQPVAGSEHSSHGALIFTESNEQALRLARLLVLLRPSWQIGTLTKSTAGASGRKTLAAFRKRKLSILIASDRASRGLDIPDLAHVVNYDMPKSATSYVHRVGRTARAGKAGQATTLVLHNQGKWFWKDKSGIAKSEILVRGPDKRVVRLNLAIDVTEEERDKYEKALQTLGDEAKR